MLRIIRSVRCVNNIRFFSQIDYKNREKRAKIEDDPFDHKAFDWESYKQNSGAPRQVEPWPRRKLKELYLFTLEFLKEFPEEWGYRTFTEELSRFRLKVVEETEDITEIEKKIGFGDVEDLIEAATKEIKLLEIFKHEKPWVPKPIDNEEMEIVSQFTKGEFGSWDYVHTTEKPENK